MENLLAGYNAESLPGREILSSVTLLLFDTLHVSLISDTIVLVSKFHPQRCCHGKVDRAPLTYTL